MVAVVVAAAAVVVVVKVVGSCYKQKMIQDPNQIERSAANHSW
jgi:hypothetical protein